MSDKQTYEEAAFPVQSPRHSAFKIAFIYASISVIWILFSDQLLSIFVKDIETITRIQMVKGWFFVLATSYLIFFLLQKDIRKYCQVEEALRHSQEQLLSLMDALPIALSWADDQSNIQYSNNKFRELFGYALEDMPTVEHWFQLAYPDQEYRQTVVSNWQIAVENAQNSGPEIAPIEVTITCKDGTTRYVAIVGTLLHDRILAVFNDLTESKRAEDALRESEKKLEAIINHHFQLTGMLDVQGRLIMANETALKYHDVAESDVIGKLFWETPWWSHSKEEQDKLRKAIHIAAKGEFVRYETSHLNKNGELRAMDFSINPVIDDEGNVKYLIPEGRDITELKEAEESLRKSESQLRTLANRLQEAEEMARKALARELHDQVGQSLTALSINLNILRNRLPPDTLEQLEERLDDSIELVEETTTTIRDVMAELRPSVLDDYGLTAALRWYGERFSDRTGISIKLKMDEISYRLAEKVESALFRITQEALTNVAKHANASELVLSFEESDGLFRLIIADNGKGFDYTVFSKAGFRTGWGILNMQERIQVLGGQLQIDSEPGKGASVIIEIRK